MKRLKAFWRWLVEAEGDEAAKRRMIEEDARRLGGTVYWFDEADSPAVTAFVNRLTERYGTSDG